MTQMDPGRPQDQGRRHRRTRAAPPDSRLLVTAYAALRAELADCVAELRPPPPPDGPLVLGDPMPKGRPSLADRDRLVALIARLLGILGAEVEEPGEAAPAPGPARPARRGRLDLG
jgi:hypothetical protein